MSDLDPTTPNPGSLEGSQTMAAAQGIRREASELKPWSWRRALSSSVLQCAGASALIYLLDRTLVAPLSPYVRLAVFAGCSGAAVLISPFLRRVSTSAFRETFLRDGPYINGIASFLFENAPAAIAYFAPALTAVLYQIPRGHTWMALSLAVKWCWAETLSLTWSGIWRGNPFAWFMAGVAIFRPYDWRLAILATCRRYLSGVVRPWALGGILSERYAYQPIPQPKHFRLLRVGPSVFGLKCSLEIHSLDNAPAFDAISYTWGNGERTHMIRIDGKLLPIQRSAYEVISSRASLWRARYMWIDAICINQDDSADKEQQVKLMRDIYESATRALVWLGDAPDAWNAFLLLHELSAVYMDKLSFEPSSLSTLGTSILKQVSDDSNKWAPLERMLARPYWYRAWIVQEIAVSKDVHILYGGYWFHWTMFSTLVGDLMSDDYGLLQKLDHKEGMSTPPFRGISQVRTVANFRNQYQQGQRWSLSRVILSFALSQASLERDRIFAFEGISTAAGHDAVKPDYKDTTPTVDVFRRAVRLSLTEGPAEDRFLMLSAAGIAGGKKGKSWPSWVADLERRSNLPAPFRLLATHAPYNANGPTTVSVGDAVNDDELALEGRIIDKITNVALKQSYVKTPGNWNKMQEELSKPDFGPESALVQCNQRNVERHEEALALAERCCGETYFNGQSRWEAFWRTQFGNKSSRGYPATDACGDDYHLFMENSRYMGALATGGQPTLPIDAAATFSSSNIVGRSAEDTLDSLQRLLTSLDGAVDVRKYLTAGLLDNHALLLEQLLAMVQLPQWAADELRLMVHESPSGSAAHTPSEEVSEIGRKAAEELALRGMKVSPEEPDEVNERRIVLFLGLLLSGTHVRFSDEQIAAIRKTALETTEIGEVLHDKRLSLWYSPMGGSRQFAITERGYMALVLPETEVGDVVAIFHGARTPHVLRPDGTPGEAGFKKYKLVGEAYLHGFMDGEAFSQGLGSPSEKLCLV